jgi:hypothetical protein
MSRKKRMKDIREAKDRRAKRLAIGGAVLLVAILAFEMPKVLKHGGSSSSTPPAATTTATTPTAPGAPTAPATTAPGTAAAASLPTTGSTKLPDSDRAPKVSKSQLLSFTHFAGKDPFVQQVNTTTSTGGSPGSSSPGTAAAAAGVITAGPPSTASVRLSGSAPQARTLAKTGAVTLSVNGSVETVRVGASFPSSNPLFRLVSVAHGVVRIGIANGSYASGSQAVSLTAGNTLTLVDTSDGARYKLRLVSGA